MIENAELIMQMLEMSQMYKQQVPVELEGYLRYVAKTGNTVFQWTLVKPFIRGKMLNVIAEFAEQSALADVPLYPNVDPFNFEAMKTVLLERFDAFNGPPFTIQRLCELLTCPRKEYNRVDKFMRAVEKNILVVSTCELRSSKREEAVAAAAVVNGVPDRWENAAGKESDVNMTDPVDKSGGVCCSPDADNVLNGSTESVESLLNELESMKTPVAKPDETNAAELEENAAQVAADAIEPNVVVATAEPKTDTAVASGEPHAQLSERVDPDDVACGSMDDAPKEHELPEVAPVEIIKEQISENVVEELRDLSDEVNLDTVEPIDKESVTESNDLNQTPEPTPTDTDRVEGSIIHQTPDSDNKAELVVAALQPDVTTVEQTDEIVESMDVQVENVTKTSEPEVNRDAVQEQCSEPTNVENDESVVDIPLDVPAVDLTPVQMDVEPEKIESNEIIEQETVLINEEITPTEPATIVEEKPEEQKNETKSTESEQS